MSISAERNRPMARTVTWTETVKELAMASVADLVEDSALRHLANPQAYDDGHRDAEAGSVKLDAFGPLQITADVADDDGVWKVVLRSGSEGLVWSCTCPAGRQYAFCRHCVATAIMTWRQSPARRSR
jgi:uncharacterized Zn finger protein